MHNNTAWCGYLPGGVIGAGSVVTKSTDPNALYYGVPARKVRELDKISE